MTFVIRRLGKQTIFSRRPVVKNKPTVRQQANRDRFAEATLFAISELKKPKASLEYKIMAELQGLKTAHLAAISDFLLRPEIDTVDVKGYKGNPGDVIHITPCMPYKVVEVDVNIYAKDGTLVEAGKAVEDELNWKYVATIANTMAAGSAVELVAHDRLRKISKSEASVNSQRS
jgi:hypothetical protein